MNLLIPLFLIISNPLYAKNLPGEWIGEIGLRESPVLSGNVFVNPATADTSDYISITSRFTVDDYKKLNAMISSITLTHPILYRFFIGGRINILYNSQIEGKLSLYNEWDSFDEYLSRKGGIDQYSLFLTKSFGDLSFGFDINLLNGEIEDRWGIVFEKREYKIHDVFDTLSTYFRGYSVGVGLLYHWNGFKVGGYYNFYQDLKYWREGEGREDLKDLERPVRFGVSYSINRRSIMFSANRKSALLMGRYGPLMIGYGRIYGSGYDLDIQGNRFITGIFFSVNRIPFNIAIENRKYSEEFNDNEYIGTITVGISGRGGK